MALVPLSLLERQVQQWDNVFHIDELNWLQWHHSKIQIKLFLGCQQSDVIFQQLISELLSLFVKAMIKAPPPLIEHYLTLPNLTYYLT